MEGRFNRKLDGGRDLIENLMEGGRDFNRKLEGEMEYKT